MFSVLFEVHPRKEQYRAYLDNAKMLRPELEKIDGFVENIRYGSLIRDGWILSLSSWRDEKSLVRWRTMVKHHEVQEKGRNEILLDYHLRVGQYTADTKLPPGCTLAEQRLDETETGDATTVVLSTAKKPDALGNDATPAAIAASLGLDESAKGYVEYDIYDAVLTPGDLILMTSFKTHEDAEAYTASAKIPSDARIRRVRVVRDYGKYDRRETPQYYPDVAKEPV
jgi:heme-degrading monooxygenase HmoA